MSQHTILQVGQPRQWNGQNGSTFIDFPLRLAGVEKVAILTQKPESPAPQPQQTLDLELLPHPRFDDKLRAKKVQQQQGFGRRPSDPAERRSIERQSCLRSAVELAQKCETLPPAEDVIAVAQAFHDWVVQA